MAERKELSNPDRKTAIIVGILFIIATAFLFIGETFYKPILSSPNYLDIAYPNSTLVIIGMLLEFVCVLAIPLIAIFLYPVLRRYSETLAIGYVVFRFFEAVLFVDSEINKLSLIGLSQQYLNNEVVDASYFHIIGSSIQHTNEWNFLIYVMIFCFGALMLYYVLYTSELVPRFISVWGFAAALFLLAGAVLTLVGGSIGFSELNFELIFAPPIAVNEMVLAIWLIVKGFNSSAKPEIKSRS
ncbi:DUF4386 domain-containing protein [Methanococcoides sp. AM1]|uniref:DUF4386 domain-containing protein n=1 Tax=Methanococcoides sp. AM1 TaxID=1201011 RepID=UPI0014383178|nr:DUF4386 domain-containing protein [Methanococcoides sp. AM1]